MQTSCCCHYCRQLSTSWPITLTSVPLNYLNTRSISMLNITLTSEPRVATALRQSTGILDLLAQVGRTAGGGRLVSWQFGS